LLRHSRRCQPTPAAPSSGAPLLRGHTALDFPRRNMTIEKTELSRRSLVKGAAWSLPVIAVAAATPMAAASTATSDLVPALSGPVDLALTLGPVNLATINVVNTLTISNIGTSASPAGATAAIAY